MPEKAWRGPEGGYKHEKEEYRKGSSDRPRYKPQEWRELEEYAEEEALEPAGALNPEEALMTREAELEEAKRILREGRYSPDPDEEYTELGGDADRVPFRRMAKEGGIRHPKKIGMRASVKGERDYSERKYSAHTAAKDRPPLRERRERKRDSEERRASL
jgi:hypothetical protein